MFFTFLGLLGVTVNLVAYALITAGRLRADDVRYQIINALGTTGILLSLIAQWNLPVFISNVAWLLIAIVGLMRIAAKRKQASK